MWWCECIVGHDAMISELVASAQDASVCTATQCFESESDAFGIVAPAQPTGGVALACIAALMLLASMLAMQHVPAAKSE